MSAQAQRAYEAYWSAFYGPDAVRRSIPWEEAGEQARLIEEMGIGDLAERLKAMMPAGRAFILMTIDYGEGGNLAYISTINREDSVRCVREWLKKQGAL